VYRYLIHLSASSILTLTAAASINWLADPYAIFGAPSIPDFNAAKPAIATNGRIFKMAGYLHRPMDALILGTSRTIGGISPKHEAFNGLRTFNLAMAAQPNAESALIFKHVSDHNQLQMAVIGLDFFASNAYLPFPDDFSQENFDRDRKLKLLLSFDTLLASKKTLFQPGPAPTAPDAARLNVKKKFTKQAFIDSEKGYMWEGTYLPGPKCRYEFETGKGETGKIQLSPPLEQIRSLIALAHQRQVKLWLFISPSHARQWETLAALGLWDRWEEWKRRLVKINEEEAVRAHQHAFPLWDFSGYNSMTTENLPDANAPNAAMRGYTDSSHYKPNIGNLVLDRLFGLNMPDRQLPQDFGVKLSSANITPHLAGIRSARMRYRQTHPQDIAEIIELERDVKARNRCITYTAIQNEN